MTCTIVFSAEVSDPDGDNFRVEWKGCEASDVDPLDCAVITGQPGVVGVRAEARDSYGITSEVTAEAAILPAAYTVSSWRECDSAHRRTRSVVVSALTLDPGRALPEPAASEACAPDP
jgi:hypothetical protein